MFKKKPVETPVAEEEKVEPVKAEEISSEEEVSEEEAQEVAQEEITEEELKAVIQKLASDVQAIKYHLRLDFI